MKRLGSGVLGAAAASIAAIVPMTASAQVGGQDYLGTIFYVGFNYCPKNSLPADGRTLNINSNVALFSLYGTTYGGNGQTTYGLPDLRGRRAIGTGQGLGLSYYQLGQASGSETVTMTSQMLPQHVHTANLRAIDVNGDVNNAVRAGLGKAATVAESAYSTAAFSQNMRVGDVQMDVAGGSQPINTTNPALALTACITTQGLFPPRN